MRFLSSEGCVNWCTEYGYGAIDPCHPRPAVASTFHQISYPADSGRKIALARLLAHWSLQDGPCLIWITESGVWPSSEHMPLYDRFRQALGETHSLIETPGHLADMSDGEDGLSVIALSLLFFWDFYVLAAVPGPMFFASHDEYAGFHVPERSEMPRDFAGW